MENKYVILPKNLYDSIMGYLQTRPYAEVGSSIPTILQEVETIAKTIVAVPREFPEKTIDEIHLNSEKTQEAND